MRPPTTVGTSCTTPPKLATRSRARVPFRRACSDGETEHAEEYKHLWGDAVYGAVDDADDGDREATRNVRHGILSFWGAPDESSWRPFWEQLSSDGRPRVRRSTPQLGAMPTTELMRPPTDGKTHGIPLFLEAGWKSLEGLVRRRSGLQVPREVPVLSPFVACSGAGLFVGVLSSASPGPVLLGQCSAFALLRVHDRRSDDAPGWLQTPLHSAAYPPDLSGLHQGGCKLPIPLGR